jgi:hypothetical protein
VRFYDAVVEEEADAEGFAVGASAELGFVSWYLVSFWDLWSGWTKILPGCLA